MIIRYKIPDLYNMPIDELMAKLITNVQRLENWKDKAFTLELIGNITGTVVVIYQILLAIKDIEPEAMDEIDAREELKHVLKKYNIKIGKNEN